MNVKNHPDPSLLAKDALRGLGYALERGLRLVVEDDPRRFPEKFEAASSEFLNSVGKLAKTIDLATKRVLGLEFDPKTFGPPSFADSSGAGTSDRYLSRDASNLFFALALSAREMKTSDLLISEVLCARMIAEDVPFDWPSGRQDTASSCMQLYRRIVAANIIGNPPGVAGKFNSKRWRDTRRIAFSTSLWVHVDRGYFDDSEEDLIKMCCDVTEQAVDDILTADRDDEAIHALFERALRII